MKLYDHPMPDTLNVPVQLWPSTAGYSRVLMYQPRRDGCAWMDDGIPAEHLPEFCETAAALLENLASQFRQYAAGNLQIVYYPDDPKETNND